MFSCGYRVCLRILQSLPNKRCEDKKLEFPQSLESIYERSFKTNYLQFQYLWRQADYSRHANISVEMILDLLSQGATVEELLEDYPALEAEDIRACLAYAKSIIASEDVEIYTNA